MAPSYSRSQNRNRNRTGYVDHDITEGLPVRQWRRGYVTVAPPPAQDNVSQNDMWAIELPHGMPPNSQLLPQYSQDLLRAARSGRLYKRPPPVDSDDDEPIIGEKPEKNNDDDVKDKGFTALAWKQVPRNLEGPPIEYLAKRRKGLVTETSKSVITGPTLTSATVKRVDAAGNEYVQNVVVPQGQKVEGEIISQTVITGPLIGGGLAPVPTPPRRKGVSKGKKSKGGPGRGRKKIHAPASVPQNSQADGVASIVKGTDAPADGEGIKTEAENGTPMPGQDTEMLDGSTHDSDDEDGEIPDDDEDDSVDIQNFPTKQARDLSSPPSSLPPLDDVPTMSPDAEMSGTEAHPIAPPLLQVDSRLELKSGSPLKQVALTSSTLNSPLESPKTTVEAPLSNLSSVVEDISALDEVMQEEAAQTAPTALPSPPPGPIGTTELEAAVETLQEEMEEDEMLLDIVENTNIGTIEDLPKIPEIPELPEASEKPEISEISETLETPEVLRTPEILETPEVLRTPEILETPKVPEFLEIPKLETSETPKVPEFETSEVLEIPELLESSEVLEISEIPEIPETLETSEVLEISEIPGILETSEVLKTSEVLEIPEISDILETSEVIKTSEVLELPETLENPKVLDILEILETPIVLETPEVRKTPEVSEISEIPEVPEVLPEVPEVPEVPQIPDISDIPKPSENPLPAIIDGDETEDDDDGFPDLLGGLEKQLNE